VLTTHPLLAPRSRKSRAILLTPIWAFGSVTGYLYLFIKVDKNEVFVIGGVFESGGKAPFISEGVLLFFFFRKLATLKLKTK
jgi:hypothetical protein